MNVVHEQNMFAFAAMGAQPLNPYWLADKAIDGNTSQNYESDSCAISDWERNRNTSIWWKVWLSRPFTIAYLELYFRSDSKFK